MNGERQRRRARRRWRRRRLAGGGGGGVQSWRPNDAPLGCAPGRSACRRRRSALRAAPGRGWRGACCRRQRLGPRRGASARAPRRRPAGWPPRARGARSTASAMSRRGARSPKATSAAAPTRASAEHQVARLHGGRLRVAAGGIVAQVQGQAQARLDPGLADAVAAKADVVQRGEGNGAQRAHARTARSRRSCPSPAGDLVSGQPRVAVDARSCIRPAPASGRSSRPARTGSAPAARRSGAGPARRRRRQAASAVGGAAAASAAGAAGDGGHGRRAPPARSRTSARPALRHAVQVQARAARPARPAARAAARVSGLARSSARRRRSSQAVPAAVFMARPSRRHRSGSGSAGSDPAR